MESFCDEILTINIFHVPKDLKLIACFDKVFEYFLFLHHL